MKGTVFGMLAICALAASCDTVSVKTVGELDFDESVVTAVDLGEYATTNYVADAVAAVDVTEQLQGYATTNELNAATNATLKAANDYTDAHSGSVSPGAEYIRSGVWVASYAPVASSGVTTNAETRTVGTRVYADETVSYTSDGNALMSALALVPGEAAPKLVSATVTDGEATADGLLVKPTGATNATASVTVAAESGEMRSALVALTRNVTRKTESYYKADAAASLRKAANDFALALASKIGTDVYQDSYYGKTVPVSASAYLFDADGAASASCLAPLALVAPYLWTDTAATGRSSAQGGPGSRFAVGKHVVGCASHWATGAAHTRYCRDADGAWHAVEVTATGVDLKSWAEAKWGTTLFKETFGFDVALLADLHLQLTATEIPAACVPSLLPLDIATAQFGTNSVGALLATAPVWLVGQNNSLYPRNLMADGYNAPVPSTRGADMREDVRAGLSSGRWWPVCGGESGHPAMLWFGATVRPCLVGSIYGTSGAGPSYVHAVPVIKAWLAEQGLDADEELKILTAADVAEIIGE